MVLFKMGLGRLVLGLSWDRLSEDYDLTSGRFMDLRAERGGNGSGFQG